MNGPEWIANFGIPWALTLLKLKKGADNSEQVTLTPNECETLVEGVKALAYGTLNGN